jgi:hypothetical protein
MSIKTMLGVFAISTGALFLSSCGEGNNGETTNTDTTQAAPAKEITLSDVPASPDFPDAQLTITSVTAEKKGTDSAKVTFNYGVKNYELKSQTADAGGKQCNNSEKGQHIHFIIDNKPYVALYEPKHEVTVPLNSEHYVMSFLSRSYHESVKSKGAALVYHFKVDANGKLEKLAEPTTPMVFYSRPKGDYLGKDTENLLFDFYVWNATLGTDYKLKAIITGGDGIKKEIEINEWKPQFIHGLAMGKANISLTLVDKNGNPVQGDMTGASRDFNLSQDEPMK